MLSRAHWYVAGPLLGLIIIGLRASVNKPLGALGGYIDITDHAARPRQLGFPAFVLLGTILGGAGFSLFSGTFAPTTAYSSSQLLLPSNIVAQYLVLMGAGVLMGLGARWAGGCTSGHGLCGNSLGSGASMAATATFFATAVLLANLLALITGGGA